MGCDADLLAIGPFSQAVASCLSYVAESYAGVPDGTLVLSTLFACPTTDVSEALAEAVQAELWGFSTHVLKPADFDWEALADLHEEDVEALRALVAAGFQIFFRPNG